MTICGPSPLPFRDFFSQRHQRFEVTAHIPHAGDSIGEQEREHEFSAAVRFARGGQMHVHVRQAGDEKLPAGVENLRAPWNCDRRRWTQSCDSFSFNDYGLVGSWLSASHIDDSDVGDDQSVLDWLRA